MTIGRFLRRPENVATAIDDRETRQTEQLKAKLEQAVFFGGSDDNPLTFSLSRKYTGDLERAAESLSYEVLTGRIETHPCHHGPPIPSTRTVESYQRHCQIHSCEQFDRPSVHEYSVQSLLERREDGGSCRFMDVSECIAEVRSMS